MPASSSSSHSYSWRVVVGVEERVAVPVVRVGRGVSEGMPLFPLSFPSKGDLKAYLNTLICRTTFLHKTHTHLLSHTKVVKTFFTCRV
jgi:hypothetical protein